MFKKNSKRKSVLQVYKETKRSSLLVYFIIRILVIFCLIRQIINFNVENIFICILTLVLLTLPMFVQKNFKIELPNTLEIIILLFVFCAEILGEINSFYQHIPIWDTMLHTLNGFLCAGVGISLVNLLNENVDSFNLSPIFVVLVSFCFSMTVGVCWEFIEYGIDKTLRFDMQKDTLVKNISTVYLDDTKTNKVISSNDKVSYTVNYNTQINNVRNGDTIVVTITDTLPLKGTIVSKDNRCTFENNTIICTTEYTVNGTLEINEVAGQFARTNLSEEERKALVKEYTDEYYRIRREQLRFIIENKSSLAAVYALYQRLPGDTYLFNGDSDVVYYRTVAEALEQSYPDSPYLQSLLAEITRMDARISLTSRISEAGYPDLELSDIYGKKVRLSSLTGKVVLLDFWSAELGNSNTLNAELKEVYKKYADAPTPFEVYQVAVDSSKPLWITAVQEQQLPWISVSDLRGQASTAPRLYNVQKLPANFLIDREGTIVAKDIYGKSLERKLDELTK